MANEVGTAFIRIRPDARTFRPEAQTQVTGAFRGLGTAATAAFGAGVAGAGLGAILAKTGVGFNAMKEQAQIAFTTMLGSAQKAKLFLMDLQKFAAATPFEFTDLTKAASSLISIGVEADKVIPIMTSLGNATSGMGTGAEGVKRATVAIQQMNAAGRITAEDLNQLRDAGIPVFDLLTAATGKTTAEIAQMAQTGKLGRKELEQLMKALETGKGLERFNGLMEKQSHSLIGLWSTVKDTFAQVSGQIMEPFMGALKEGLVALGDFLGEIGKARTTRAKLNVVWDLGQDAFKSIREKLFGGVQEVATERGAGTVKIRLDGMIQQGLESTDWGAVGTAVLDGFTRGLTGGATLAIRIGTFVQNAMHSIDWNKVGREAGPALAAAVASAFVTLTDPSFWIKNWDLALSIALVALSGPVGRLASRVGLVLGGALAKGGGEAIESFAGVLSRFFGERLGQLFQQGAAVAGRGVVILVTAIVDGFGALFDKIGAKFSGWKGFVLKIFAWDAIINASVAGATALWNGVKAKFDDAENWLKIKSEKIVLAIVEPLSHLPRRLGGGPFQDLKAKMQRQIAEAQFDQLGASITSGVAMGITRNQEQVETAMKVTVARARQAGDRAAQARSPAALMFELGENLAAGIAVGLTRGGRKVADAVGATVRDIQKYGALFNKVGYAISYRLIEGLTAADFKDVGGKLTGKFNSVGQMIVAAARKYGVDARAALAVAMTEGGVKFGAVGDRGTSFGPFQEHIGGVLGRMDTKKAAAFANSLQGVEFALRKMAEAGAAGKTGLSAVEAIVRGFERPANPGAEIAKAWANYKNGIDMGVADTKGGLRELANAAGVGGAAFVAKLKEKLEEARKATAEKLADLRGRLSEGFSNLSQLGVEAIGKRAAQQTPAERQLDEARKYDERLALQRQYQDASDALAKAKADGDAEQIAAAERQMQDAIRAQQEYALQQQADAQRKAADEKAARDEFYFQRDLERLQKHLAKTHATTAESQKEINALLQKYGIDYRDSGNVLGLELAYGIRQAMGEIQNVVKQITLWLKRQLKLKSPAEEGDLADLDQWFTGFVPTLFSGIDPSGVILETQRRITDPLKKALQDQLVDAAGIPLSSGFGGLPEGWENLPPDQLATVLSAPFASSVQNLSDQIRQAVEGGIATINLGPGAGPGGDIPDVNLPSTTTALISDPIVAAIKEFQQAEALDHVTTNSWHDVVLAALDVLNKSVTDADTHIVGAVNTQGYYTQQAVYYVSNAVAAAVAR